MTTDGGLRERKKAATRAALCTAALRLALERGLGHVTVDDIASAAQVSPRTFNNYFAGKEQALAACILDWMQAVLERLQSRPVDEPVWDSVRAAFLEFGADVHSQDDARMQLLRVVHETPSLKGHLLAAILDFEERLAGELASRAGLSVLSSRLFAATLINTLRVATLYWSDSGDPQLRFADVLTSAFDDVARGWSREPADRTPSPLRS